MVCYFHHVIGRKVISTLDQTRKDARKMRESIKSINKEFESAKDKTFGLMKKLTHRATVLEKLKAKVSILNVKVKGNYRHRVFL